MTANRFIQATGPRSVVIITATEMSAGRVQLQIQAFEEPATDPQPGLIITAPDTRKPLTTGQIRTLLAHAVIFTQQPGFDRHWIERQMGVSVE